MRLQKPTLSSSRAFGVRFAWMAAWVCAGLGGTTTAYADPAEVVINPSGGLVAGTGLQVHVGNAGSLQIVRNGSGQLWDGTLFTTADGQTSNGFFVGNATTGDVYGLDLSALWTPVSQTAVSGAGTLADPYRVETVISANGLTASIAYRYVSPSDVIDVRATVTPPLGNTDEFKAFHFLDTSLGGTNLGPNGVGFAQPGAGTPFVLGAQATNLFGLFVQRDRAWDGYDSAYWEDVADAVEAGTLTNTLSGDTDNAIAVQWNLGTPTAPVTWNYRLMFTESVGAVCGNGAIEGFEACDDGAAVDGNGCNAICQLEAGFVCGGAPSTCGECVLNTDCNDGNECTVDACTANSCGETPTAAGTACTGGVCDGASLCVACIDNTQCGGATPFCDTATNVCTSNCTDDAQCSGATPFCLIGTGACVECLSATECDDGNDCTTDSCTSNACVSTSLTGGTACLGGVCDGQPAPSCVECVTGSDCIDGNSCTVDSCVGNVCSNPSRPARTPCAGGLCDGRPSPSCVACLIASDCDDSNECTVDSCASNTCSSALEPAGTPCSGGVCDGVASPECVECVSAAQCSGVRSLCEDASNTCVQCTSNDQCAGGTPTCDLSSGLCGGCESNADCSGDTPLCSTTNGACVECLSGADCDDNNECTADSCLAGNCFAEPSAAGSACADGVCDGRAEPACVDCVDADQCGGATAVCDPGANICVGCSSSRDCREADKPFCEPSEQVCGPCGQDADCDDDNDCTADACVDARCRHTAASAGETCGQDGVCLGDSNASCVGCIDSAHDAADNGCEESLPVCEVVGQLAACVACEDSVGGKSQDFGCSAERPVCKTANAEPACVTCEERRDCPLGQRCATDGTCLPPCSVDSECPTSAPFCELETSDCVECLVQSDCQGTQVCGGTYRCTQPDTDGDGVDDPYDHDDDNDGIQDALELAAGGAQLAADSDADGVLDFQDPDFVACQDADGEGVCDALPVSIDKDADGLANHLDRDADGDGLPDTLESDALDSDLDGALDEFRDANGNGYEDTLEAQTLSPTDTDNDGYPDFLDLDSDQDHIADAIEATDVDLDGEADVVTANADSDTDGLDDAFDPSTGGVPAAVPDSDADGIPDYRDATFDTDVEDDTTADDTTFWEDGGTGEDTSPTAEPLDAAVPEPTSTETSFESDAAPTPVLDAATPSLPDAGSDAVVDASEGPDTVTVTPDAGSVAADAGLDPGDDTDCECRAGARPGSSQRGLGFSVLAASALLWMARRRARSATKPVTHRN